jgi:hypothetical protein
VPIEGGYNWVSFIAVIFGLFVTTATMAVSDIMTEMEFLILNR